MNALDIFKDGMALLGIYDYTVAPTQTQNHVLNDLTAALQVMQLAGDDFYCRQEESVAVVAGTASYTLSATQKVLGVSRLASTGQPLIALQSRTQFDTFGKTYLGYTGAIPQGTPLAYFIESSEPNAGNDSVGLTVNLVPTPPTNDTLYLYVIPNAPTYALTDLTGGSPPTPPVPHQYISSILLPIFRMYVTSCDLFGRNSDKLPAIQAQFENALSLLGLADPRPNTKMAVSPELRAAKTSQQTQGDAQ